MCISSHHLSFIAPSKPCLYSVCFSGPGTPTGVSTDVTGSSTVEVSWTPSLSGMCDVFSTGYIIRYRLSNSTGDYTTVNISGTTSVTLRDLAPNAEYDVEVAAINSNGATSHFSAVARFTVTPPEEAEPSKILYVPIYIVIICLRMPTCVNMAACCPCVSPSVACPCSPVGACVGAAGGGFIGGVLLTAAIAGCLACAVFYRIRTNREVTAKRE